MEDSAICLVDFSILARTDPMAWDPTNVFERLIPRREMHLKRNLLHASQLQIFSRNHADDAGVTVSKNPHKQGDNKNPMSVFDLAIGAKDLSLISVVPRPMPDLSSHVAMTLKNFLEQYPTRFANVDFLKLRMSPLITALLKHHIKEYLGPDLAAMVGDSIGGGGGGGSGHHHGSGGGSSSSSSSSSAGSSTGGGTSNNDLKHLLGTKSGGGGGGGGGSDHASSNLSSAASITSSVVRAFTGQVAPIKFGPPIELLSSCPLSVHILPYGRNAFFPELLERRRQLEQASQVDPIGWRSIVYPPKLLAAVLRWLVVILNVPARVVLPRLQEVLPGAVAMHYQLSGEEVPPSPNSNANKKGGNQNYVIGTVLTSSQQEKTSSSSSSGATTLKFPTTQECGIGLRYYARINEATQAIVSRAHMLSADALLILHYSPNPVFGSKFESPLITQVRSKAMQQGVSVTEKIDLVNQQDLLQVFGMLARKHPHVFVAFEDINAFGGSLTPESRLVLTRLACNKFTLLCDGTYNVANPCGATRSHWLNSARNAPGSGCADAYLIGVGAFLPTVVGRAAVVVYPATKCALDVQQILTDPILPLLIDDSVVIHVELTKAMGATELAEETTRACQGIADDAKEQLKLNNKAHQQPQHQPVVRSGIAVIPVPQLAGRLGINHASMLNSASLGSSGSGAGSSSSPTSASSRRQFSASKGRALNQALQIESFLHSSLETIGVSCCCAFANVKSPHLLQNQQQQQSQHLAQSVTATESEDGSVYCAIMSPHLQTIEQVPWDLVWRVLNGNTVAHPELAPTLEPPPSESEREKSKKKSVSAHQLELQKMSKQDHEDQELLSLIRTVMGENAKDADKLQDTTGDTDPLARDPYSYASRLDNLLACYEPLRAGSARAMMDGMLEESREDFFGHRYEPLDEIYTVSDDDDDDQDDYNYDSGEGEGGEGGGNRRGGKKNNKKKKFDPFQRQTSSSKTFSEMMRSQKQLERERARRKAVEDQNPMLRRDILESVHLGRLVLRLGREPGDNAPMMIASVLKEYATREQFEKFPVLLDAYRGKESELLESLVDKFVPPHRRGMFKARTMMLRAPVVPEPDVAVARRMVHKCLAAHRKSRIGETSSIAHLLAPLVTLRRQTSSNPLSSSSSSSSSPNNNRTNSNNKQKNALLDEDEELAGPSAFDFLKEEDSDGIFVKRILEEEIGLVPRAVGVSVASSSSSSNSGGTNSPFRDPSRTASTNAIKELVKNHQHRSRSNSPSGGGSGRGGSKTPPRATSVGGGGGISRFGQGTNYHPYGATSAEPGEFLNRLFDPSGRSSSSSSSHHNSGNSASWAKMANSSANNNTVVLDEDEQSPRSASYALAAANQAESGKALVFVPPPIRARVVRIYQQYDPARIPHVDELLAAWKGKEELLIQSLSVKYGPEPAFNAPIRTNTRRKHHTDPNLERPGHLINVMRGFYENYGGPDARNAIDGALETAFPLETAAQRVTRKIRETAMKEMENDL